MFIYNVYFTLTTLEVESEELLVTKWYMFVYTHL